MFPRISGHRSVGTHLFLDLRDRATLKEIIIFPELLNKKSADYVLLRV